MNSVRPFRVQVSDEAIADLKQRLDNARWPDQVNDGDWSYGTELNYLQELVAYWRQDFDWRAQEARLNRFDQFLLTVDGLDLHFIHQRSPHADATPLIITHGWPGCIAEFVALIPRLTEPDKFGGRAEDACHVVCPSLPGFAWSQAATEPGMGTRAIAERQVKLMAALGYQHYVAQGGDWGAMVSRHMADLDPEHCSALHLNMVLALPPEGVDDPMAAASDDEKARFANSQRFLKEGMGYYKIQATRPQTLGYALQDSPLGLCAWLTEKYRAWTDCDGEIRNALSWDQLLTIVSLYWYSNSITSSLRIYCEESRHGQPLKHIATPTGAVIYPRELVQPPRSWIAASYNLQHYRRQPRGGHFAALEQPALFAEDLWQFLRALRG